MDAITKEECLKQFDKIVFGNIFGERQREQIKDLIELAYKSGHHDGWYAAVKAIEENQQRRKR